MQSIGLETLIPMALFVLQDNPLTDAEYYPGDLFKTLLGVEKEFWETNPGLRQDVASHVKQFESNVADLNEAIALFKSQSEAT